jgi:hypothetical protein
MTNAAHFFGTITQRPLLHVALLYGAVVHGSVFASVTHRWRAAPDGS